MVKLITKILPFAIGCNETAQADIVLLVDSSGSIGDSDFEEVRNFLHAFVDGFNLRPNKVKMGLAQFSDRPYQEFLLGEYLDKRDLHQKLNSLIYRRGGTNTGQALTFIRENYFSLARKNVPGVAIVITDGDSNDDVEEPSQKLRNLGVFIFVIRVGTGNMEKLRAISNIPHEEFLFSIGSYQELEGLKESLHNKVCFTVTLQSEGNRFYLVCLNICLYYAILEFRYLKINANKTKTFLKCTKFDSHHNDSIPITSAVVCTLVLDSL